MFENLNEDFVFGGKKNDENVERNLFISFLSFFYVYGYNF